MEKGDTPPGIVREHQHVRSAAVVLPPDKHFKDAARETLVVQKGREHVTV
jgi:phthalate 4,5-dioxygenase oxygenase subunit